MGVLDTSLNGIMSLAPIKDELNNVVDFKWTMVNNKAQLDMGYNLDLLSNSTLNKILLQHIPQLKMVWLSA